MKSPLGRWIPLILFSLILFSLTLVPLAEASVPRVIVAEDFGHEL